MNTYEENLDVKRKLPPARKNHKHDIVWNLLDELPLQWLEDYHLTEGILPCYQNASRRTQDPNVFGVAYYNDGSLASGFQIEATDPQFLSESQANTIHSFLESAIIGIEREHHLQFLWYTLDEDEDTLANFIHDRDGLTNHPLQTYVRNALLKRERQRLAAGILKSYRAACFLNVPYQGHQETNSHSERQKKSGLFSDLANILLNTGALVKTAAPRHPERHALLELTRKTVEATTTLMRGFAATPGISVRPLNSTQIYRMLRRTWSQKAWAIDKLSQGETLETLYSPLTLALPSYYVLEEVDDSWGWTWKTGDTWHRLLSLRIPPSFADVGTVVAQMVAQDNAEIFNSEYSLTLRPTRGTQALASLHTNLKIYKRQYEGSPREHQNLLPIIEAMQAQMDKLSRSDGSHVFDTALFIHIWHNDQKTLDRWESSLSRTFSIAPLKARIGLEQYNSLPYYIGYCTPGFTRCTDRHRCFTYLANEAVTHIPLLGQADGFVQDDPHERRAPMILESHRGTLYAQDDFARGKVNAFNGIAVGTTGSGKSMYYNLKIARTFSPRDIIIGIDGAVANGSYRALTKMLAGSDAYIETGLDQEEKTHAKNPLFTELLPDGTYREPTTEEVARMVANIEPMVRSRPTQALVQQDRAQLTAAIHIAFENFREQNGKVFLRCVAKALRDKAKGNNDSMALRAREMSQHLEEQWCYPKGTYWRFVDTDSTPTPKHLTIYDLKGVSSDETLKGVIIASYLNHIHTLVAENLKKPESERCRIHVIIDEGWSALMDPVMVTSLMGLYRAGRGRNVAVHCLTQQMADFKKILIASDPASGSTTFDPNNNAILGNTTWYNLFRSDPQDIAVTQEILQLAPNQAEELGQLGAKPGDYREMIQYVRLSNGTAFNKLLIRPLPFELAAYTSDSRDLGKTQAIRQEILKGWSTPEEAIKSRARVIDELEEAGFEDCDHQINDEQAIEMLVALRYARTFANL